MIFLAGFVVLTLQRVELGDRGILVYGYSWFTALCVLIVVVSLADSKGLGKFFAHGIFRHFGRYSYFMYLFHIPVFGLMHGIIFRSPLPHIHDFPTVAVSLGAFGVLWALAWISWNFLEKKSLSVGYRIAY
jgi:peptidoglycan/LPS O-acetylase OafA/YrhL